MRNLVAAAHPRQQRQRRARRAVRAGSGAAAPGRTARRRPGRGRWSPSPRGCRAPARRCRSTAFMSSESHSSTTMSSPSRNSSTVSVVSPASKTRTGRYGSTSAIRRAATARLVHAEVEHRRGHPVEVGQFEAVEVGEPQLPAQPLGRQRVGDDVADAESGHADAQRAEPVLLVGGDDVAVAVQPHARENPAAPGRRRRCAATGSTPTGRGSSSTAASGAAAAGAALRAALDVPVEELDARVGAQPVEHRAIGGVVGVQELGRAHVAGRRRRRSSDRPRLAGCRTRAQIGPSATIVNGTATGKSPS